MEHAVIFVDGDWVRAERIQKSRKRHGHTVISRTGLDQLGGHIVKVVVLGPKCSGPDNIAGTSSYDAADDWLDRTPNATIIDASGQDQPGGDHTMAADVSDQDIIDFVNRL